MEIMANKLYKIDRFLCQNMVKYELFGTKIVVYLSKGTNKFLLL